MTVENFNSILLQYAMERFLFRLSKSAQCEQFILKGGVLFYLWTEKKYRPTKDLDFSYYGDFDKELMFKDIQSICNLVYPEDGLSFTDFNMSGIKEDHEYEGIRVVFTAWLNKTKIPMQLDISTGDKITPGTLMAEFPQLLKMDAPELKTYPKETVFAEKFEATVKLDLTTSRMKDIYDLFILILCFEKTIDLQTLSKAIQVTFEHRGTTLPKTPVQVFSEYFYDDQNKQKQWSAFIRKTLEKELTLKAAIEKIADYINPLLKSIISKSN
jgi:predicted nucleotidyltransferase component of viral defense system